MSYKIQCPICESIKVKLFIERNEFFSISSDGSKILASPKTYFCKKCSFFFKLKNKLLLKKINNIYDSYQLYGTTLSETKLYSFLFDKFEKRSVIITKLLEQKKLLKKVHNYLDVGYGKADLLLNLSKTFPDVNLYGYEYNQNQPMSMPYGNNIKKLYNGNINKIKQKFEFISLHHVLEHIQNISSALSNIYKILNLDGLLLIQVPNIEENIFDFATYDHIYHFNKNNLINLLNRYGFTLNKEYKLFNKELTLLFQKKDSIKNSKIFKTKKVICKKYSLKNFFKKINNRVNRYDNISIFGAGQKGILLFNNLSNKEKIKFFIDEDKNKFNKNLCGVQIKNPKKINNSTKVLLIDNKDGIFRLSKKYPKINFIKFNCNNFF